MASEIHPSAIIDASAVIGDNVTIGPYCVVGPDVTIGAGSRLHSHAVIESDTELGERCELFPFACVGAAPQDLKYRPEHRTKVRIGAGTVLRESVTVHRASVSGDGVTEIGDNCFIMAYVHIAHDCKLGNSVIMANCATLAGHVTISDHVFMSGFAAAHQFVRIGPHVMVGGMTRIVKDVPPYVMVQGADDTKLYGLNRIGLERKGFSAESIKDIERAYSMLSKKGMLLSEAVRKVQEELPYTDEIRTIVEFFSSTGKRGVYR